MDSGRRDQEDVTSLVTIVITARPDLAMGGELGPMLQSVLERARAAWPELSEAPETFIAHVARKLQGDPVQALAKLHTDDLYLACACARGERAALAAFDRECLSVIDRAVARLDGGADLIAEVRQIVRQLVLVPREDGPPRIAEFSGHSRLEAWVRAIAAREAVRLLKKNRREEPEEEDEIAEAIGPDIGPELQYFRQLYLAEFKAALREAIDALSDRQKILLRQNVLDGASIDRLAALYGVHRATAARWLADARESLLTGTRKALLGRLQVRPSELDSILRLIESELDVSLRKMLT